MKIHSANHSTTLRRSPQAVPKKEVVSLTDALVQRGTGAVATTVPAALGWAGASIGEALAGTPGRIIGGAVVALGTAAGAYSGINKIPTTDANVKKRIAGKAALKLGLSAALGAAGGGLGVAGAALGGALTSAGTLDLAEGLLAHGPQPASTNKPEGVEDVTLKTSDGLELNAWLTPGKDDDPVAIFFHSNGTNLEDNIERMEQLQNLGFRVLAPEYRGYGDSPGVPTERGLKKDAKAAYDFARTLVPADKILLAGQSLGGGVAAELASKEEHGALVLESTFTSLADGSEQLMGPLIGKLTRGRYPTINSVAELKSPLFVGHGAFDDMVGTTAGRELAENAPEATYFEASGAGHMNVYSSPGYKEALAEFVKGEF